MVGLILAACGDDVSGGLRFKHQMSEIFGPRFSLWWGSTASSTQQHPRKTIRPLFCPASLCGPTGTLIKADWGLSTVSPRVQQRHSVWDYHTCGSGINPSRDMGTRNRGLQQSSVQREGGGGDIPGLCPHEPKVDVDQLVGEVLWLIQVCCCLLKTLMVAGKAQNSRRYQSNQN